MISITNIHESYNARTLTTDQVCKKFITNRHFASLSGSNHSLLIGPRGSGKTTLMKMLQVEALEIWKHNEADLYRKKIEYTGVFIPTDRIWKQQFEKIIESINDKSFAEKLVTEVFIYHTLEQVAKALEFRINRNSMKKNNFKRILLEKHEEKDLVFELSNLWKVDPIIPTLRSLCSSLSIKKKDLTKIIYNLSHNTVAKDNYESFNDLLSLVSTGISIINNYVNENGSKWALLFDELELAPEQIIQPLIDSMRGGPEEIIIKLSLSPYHKNLEIGSNPLGPSKGNDYIYIYRSVNI